MCRLLLSQIAVILFISTILASPDDWNHSPTQRCREQITGSTANQGGKCSNFYSCCFDVCGEDGPKDVQCNVVNKVLQIADANCTCNNGAASMIAGTGVMVAGFVVLRYWKF